MSSKIVFFGNERLATGVSTTTPVVRALLAAGYGIQAIVSQHETGQSRKPRPLEIAAVAAEHQIPLLLPHKISDIMDELKSVDAEVGVLVAFGKIVPQSLIDIFPRGIINIHPSALPKHRGPTPLESVLLSGETTTAVSLMSLGAKMDAGPLYVQQSVPLTGYETKQQLADQLLVTGTQLVIKHLPAILDGNLRSTAQLDADASYDALITKQDGVIDWQQPAAVIERQVRAYAGWPKSRSTIGSHDIVVTKAHVVDETGTPGVIWRQNRQLGVHTGDGVLVIDQLIPAAKNPMSGGDFLLGHKL